MSLINEALKKAQRQRTEDPGGTAPMMTGGGPRVTKRGQPRTSQQLVLLASGVVVLVVLTVVATVWLINRPAEPKPAPVISTPTPKSADTPVAPLIVVTPPPAPVTPAPVVVAPKTQPATTVAPTPTPPPVTAPVPPPVEIASRPSPAQATKTAPPAPSPATPPMPLSDTPPAAAATPPSPENRPAMPASASVAAPAKSDERIHVFIDAIRVTGIRSSGDESRVLMNDRVFRVNDIVDRNLGLRLTKVDSNVLTFTDGNGTIYTKNF